MSNEKHIILPGSERAEVHGITHIGPVPDDDPISVTLLLRRKAELPEELIHSSRTVRLHELVKQYGSNPADVAAVAETLHRFGLDAVEEKPGSRHIQATRSAKAFSHVFGCELNRVSQQENEDGPAVTYRYRTGPLRVPAELDGVVTAVLGLDNRSQTAVLPHLVRPRPPSTPRSSWDVSTTSPPERPERANASRSSRSAGA
ncbi:MAG: protease pro-enzyme activation domain-containing protein [Segniliparus sp.]|uniref:protease pro-enzyme activation domain-containing protein n=1 Tax=Segniliparus sp. TaxID=2804064 RepID=UPI003F2C3FAA